MGRTLSKLNSNRISKPQPPPPIVCSANLNNKVNQLFLLVVCLVNPKIRLFRLATYLVNNRNSPNSKIRLGTCLVNNSSPNNKTRLATYLVNNSSPNSKIRLYSVNSNNSRSNKTRLFLLVAYSVNLNSKIRLFLQEAYSVNLNNKIRLAVYSANLNNKTRPFLQAAYSANLNLNRTNKLSLDSLNSRNSNNNQETFLEADLELLRTRAIHSSRKKMRSVLVLLEQTRSSNLSNRACSVTRLRIRQIPSKRSRHCSWELLEQTLARMPSVPWAQIPSLTNRNNLNNKGAYLYEFILKNKTDMHSSL